MENRGIRQPNFELNERKAQGDRDPVRRLIESERQRDQSLAEIELYRDVIARFDKD